MRASAEAAYSGENADPNFEYADHKLISPISQKKSAVEPNLQGSTISSIGQKFYGHQPARPESYQMDSLASA